VGLKAHRPQALRAFVPFTFAPRRAPTRNGEFDEEVAEWRIPAAKMKMKALHIVPLSRQALDILKALRPLTGEGRYLFPSERSAERPMRIIPRTGRCAVWDIPKKK